MSPPSLIVLDSRRILVQWTTPAIPNGVITNYTVLYAVSTDPSNTLTSINVTAAIQELTVSGNYTIAISYHFPAFYNLITSMANFLPL